MDYSHALGALTRWASTRAEVRALVLTGSAAAGAAHTLSDRDIEVFTTDLDALLRDESWWSDLGDVLVVERLEDGDGNPSRLIYYAGGKIDFTLMPARRLSGRVYTGPFRVLLDKDEAAATASRSTPTPAMPTVEDFDESVNWARAVALMQARAIVRDEPWSAKLRDHVNGRSPEECAWFATATRTTTSRTISTASMTVFRNGIDHDPLDDVGSLGRLM